ncbi:dephospho-CoA kinase [Flavobacterium polysaccharolyticum]|uniref:Dephospho-CoA kinase n=1 Tax=Flavobacterium polysaccharolyticum TaxID=3133148 RepID=A0ABU9NNF9_9FLAO
MTKIIGLTGGIGSGKTTVANYFKELGVPVYIADDAAKEVMQSEAILYDIRKTFGDTIFDKGILIREKLASIVFTNSEKLQQLNAIVHPAVAQHFKTWLSNYQQSPFIIYESAILFESGGDQKCDKIITVTAPVAIRIERVIGRDSTTKEQVLQRINSQWTDAKRIEKSDFVIENTDFNETKAQIVKILKIL